MAESNTFVVDASYTLQVVLPDERSVPSAQKALNLLTNPKNKIVSSNLLEFEVGNGLKSAYLSSRVTKEALPVLLKNFSLLAISFREINQEEVLRLAVDKNLSFYDATYVYLTKKLNAQLLTLDENLSDISDN